MLPVQKVERHEDGAEVRWRLVPPDVAQPEPPKRHAPHLRDGHRPVTYIARGMTDGSTACSPPHPVCMYVCMCVCMYVGMYVCMYVCMNVCMYVVHTQTHTTHMRDGQGYLLARQIVHDFSVVPTPVRRVLHSIARRAELPRACGLGATGKGNATRSLVPFDGAAAGSNMLAGAAACAYMCVGSCDAYAPGRAVVV